jgi:hypothetical protein
MKATGRYEIEFDITMDNGYIIPYDLLDKFFNEYTLDIISNDITKRIYLHNPTYNYTPIFKYYCNKGYLKSNSTTSLLYAIKDPNFVTEFTKLYELYSDIRKNKTVYKREFLIDNII